jgi:hypothetical protein
MCLPVIKGGVLIRGLTLKRATPRNNDELSTNRLYAVSAVHGSYSSATILPTVCDGSSAVTLPLTPATHAAKTCFSPFQGATVDIGWEAAVAPPSLDLKDR